MIVTQELRGVNIPTLTRSRTSKAGVPGTCIAKDLDTAMSSDATASTSETNHTGYGAKRPCPFYKRIPGELTFRPLIWHIVSV